MLKNLLFGNFVTHFVNGFSPILIVRWNGKIQSLWKFKQRVLWLSYECFVTQARLAKWKWRKFNFFTNSYRESPNSVLTCKTSPVHFVQFVRNSWVAHESSIHKMHEKTVLKGSKCQFFKYPCLFAFCDSLSQNHKISSKLNKSCLYFFSWTTLRYFLTLLIFQFLRFGSRLLKT